MSSTTDTWVRWLRDLAAALLASVLVTACGGGSVGPEATRAPVTESGRISSATIGSGGGRVTATASSGVTYTLEIPAGALSAPVRISLTPISDMGSAPLARQTFGAVLLEPSGLILSIPATLRIGATPTLTGGRKLVGFSSANDGSKFAINLARVDGSSALVNLTHFSIGGGAAATPADILPLAPLVPTLADADDAIAQLSALTARDAGLVQIVDVFRQWYVEIVKPALTAADGSTDIVFMVNSVIAYKTWISTMDYIADRNSLELALAGELNESRPIATRVFNAAINGQLGDCGSAALTIATRLASLSLASSFQSIGQSVGLAGIGSGLDRPTFLQRANNCVRPVLDPMTLPTPLTIGTSKSLDARAQAVFSGTPDPQSVPFAFSVTATGASVQTPEGFSDAAGRYTTVFTPSADSTAFTVKACLVIVSDICVTQQVADSPGKFRLTSFVGLAGPFAPPCGRQSDITLINVSLPFSSSLPACPQATNSISATRVDVPGLTTISVSGTIGVDIDRSRAVDPLRGENSAQVEGSFFTEIVLAQTSLITVSVPPVLPTVAAESLSATVLGTAGARWAINVTGTAIGGGISAGASAERDPFDLGRIATTLTLTESRTVPPGKYFVQVETLANCTSARGACKAGGSGEFGKVTVTPVP